MSLQSAVQQRAELLSSADHRLLRELLSNPTAGAFMSAAELAERGGVHQAAATRLAKKLGYRGYPHLRAELQAELLESISPAERVRRRLEHAGDAGILAAVVEDEVAALSELPNQVSQDRLNAAAQLIATAERTHVFGHGHATALVDLIVRRLRRSGHLALPLTGSGRDLAEGAAMLTSRDLVVAFALRRRPPGLRPLLDQATRQSTPVLLITDAAGPLMGLQSTIHLSARRGPESEFQSLTVPMAICNALVLTLARLDTDSVAALEGLTELIEAFEREEARYPDR